jgi:hypothetical protein
MRVTIVLSQLSAVEKVRKYYTWLPDLNQEKDQRQGDIETKIKELIDAATEVPSLL